METISKNSEILFIYDAKMCNPNGDMDNENKPRMDWDTNTNLVSDVRLKRYIRDYFEKDMGLQIYITSQAKDAKDRNTQIKHKWMDMIDCRLFGVVTASDKADHFTGPVQFNWGFSLNPVELNTSHTITSSFSSGEGVGKDFRVHYSLLAFSGSINAEIALKNAEKSKTDSMTDEDLKLFDTAVIKSIPANRTRSKTGQAPRLYIRIQMKDSKTFLKDLREYVHAEYSVDEFKVRDISHITVAITPLVEYLQKNKDQLDTVYFWKDDNIVIDGWSGLDGSFSLKEIKPDGK